MSTVEQGINLTKGGRIDLSKTPNLNKLRVELTWKPNPTDTGADFDVDSSVFMCKMDATGTPKLISNKHFIFYNELVSPDGAVVHSGDDTTGVDGEIVRIDLSKLGTNVEEISFIVTIHEAAVRKQNFGQVNNAKIAIFNDETGDRICGYAMDDDFSTETAVQFGSLYKKEGGAWAFKAVGSGYQLGLAEFVTGYGGGLQ